MKKHTLTLTVVFLFFAASICSAQWIDQTSPVSVALYTVSAVNDSTAWAAGDAGTVIMTTDGGTTWSSVGGGAIGSDPVYNIYGVDASTALVTSSSSSATFIYRTTNGGADWTQVFTQNGGFLDAITMFDSTNGFAYGDPVGGNWELYRTSDGGQTWTAANTLAQNGTEAGWNNAMYTSDSTIYFGTNNSTVYYSNDMGNTWSAQTTQQTNAYSIWFNDSSNGFIGGESALNTTTNGGTSWDTTSALPGTGTIGAITGIDSMLWAARQDNKIYQSNDLGKSWFLDFTAQTAGAYYAISKSRDDSLIVAVRSDGGISTNRIQTPVGITQKDNAPLTFNLTQNYPNPFNPTTTISYNLTEQSQVKLSVYNILGQEVAVLVNGIKTAGSHQAVFNAEALPSGAYLYKLQQGNSVMVKKMLLLK